MQENRVDNPDWGISIQRAKILFAKLKRCNWDDFIEEEDLEEIRNQPLTEDIPVVKTKGGDNVSNVALYFALLCIKLSYKLIIFYKDNGRRPNKKEFKTIIPKCPKDYMNMFVNNLDLICAIVLDVS